MSALSEDWLDGLWYLAATSRELKRGELLRRMMFGAPLVFGRTNKGDVFAMRDVCPHRAAPLSAGRLLHDSAPVVECPYHGWRFRAADGVCLSAPALSEKDKADPSSIAVQSFPVLESSGLVWVYRGAGAPEISPPDIDMLASARPKTVTVVEAEGPYDEAVLGLIDPAHTPVVHKQWWWRDGAPRKEKEKTFEPTEFGFRMPPHQPSANSRIYKIIGGAPTTTIEFRLPGLRLEHIRTAKRTILGLTAMTPISNDRTRITHCVYHDMPFLSLFTPVVQSMSDSFLAQDGAILTAQNQNLSVMEHRPLYLGQPDEPSKWYFQMKRAWTKREEAGGFKNPAPNAVLRWKT